MSSSGTSITIADKDQIPPIHAVKVYDRNRTPRLRNLYRNCLKIAIFPTIEMLSLLPWNGITSLWREERTVSFLSSWNVFREKNATFTIRKGVQVSVFSELCAYTNIFEKTALRYRTFYCLDVYKYVRDLWRIVSQHLVLVSPS